MIRQIDNITQGPFPWKQEGKTTVVKMSYFYFSERISYVHCKDMIKYNIVYPPFQSIIKDICFYHTVQDNITNSQFNVNSMCKLYYNHSLHYNHMHAVMHNNMFNKI